jgi:hypothetical protein
MKRKDKQSESFVYFLSSLTFLTHSLRLLSLVLFVPGSSWQRLDFDIFLTLAIGVCTSTRAILLVKTIVH